MRPGLLGVGPSQALETVFCVAVWGQKLVAVFYQVGPPLCQPHAEVGTWDLGCPLLPWAGSLLGQRVRHFLLSVGMELEIYMTNQTGKLQTKSNQSMTMQLSMSVLVTYV